MNRATNSDGPSLITLW